MNRLILGSALAVLAMMPELSSAAVLTYQTSVQITDSTVDEYIVGNDIILSYTYDASSPVSEFYGDAYASTSTYYNIDPFAINVQSGTAEFNWTGSINGISVLHDVYVGAGVYHTGIQLVGQDPNGVLTFGGEAVFDIRLSFYLGDGSSFTSSALPTEDFIYEYGSLKLITRDVLSGLSTTEEIKFSSSILTASVPLPAAGYLFVAGFIGLFSFKRSKRGLS